MNAQPEAVKDLKEKSCTGFKYKTFLVSRSDAHDILKYIEELEGEIITYESIERR